MMQAPKRKEKKSESLDVRLPYSVKQNFMASARLRGETASEAVRRFIDSYVEETEAEIAAAQSPYKEMKLTVIRNPLKSFGMAASAAAAAVAFAAMPSAASEPAYYSMVFMGDEGAPSLVERDADGALNIVPLDINGDGKSSSMETSLALGGDIDASYFSLKANHQDGTISFTSDQTVTVSFDPASYKVLNVSAHEDTVGKLIFFAPVDEDAEYDFNQEASQILQVMRGSQTEK